MYTVWLLQGEVGEDATYTRDMQLWIFIGAAFLATIPGALVARLYLNSKQVPIDPDKGTVATFLEVAPGAVKFGVIGLNFLMFIVIMVGANILLA